MIAIVIPCYNNISYTKNAITSMIANSISHDTHFFIVDNGSTDGTSEYAKNIGANLITNASNLGVAKAWNQGLGAALDANADIICLLNNDIVVGPYWLDTVVSSLAKNPKCFYFPNGSIGYSGDNSFYDQCRREFPNLKGQTEPTGQPWQASSGKCGWAMFFNRQAVQDFFPIPEQFRIWYNDDYIYYRLRDCGYDGMVLKDCMMHHFESKTLALDKSKFDSMIQDDRKAFMEYAKEKLPSAAIRVQMGY